MSLFLVSNGFSGSAPVGVLVDATDDADALTQGASAFDDLERGPSYSERLTVVAITLPHVGEFG